MVAFQGPGSGGRADPDGWAPSHVAATVTKMPGGRRDRSVFEFILETVLKDRVRFRKKETLF